VWLGHDSFDLRLCPQLLRCNALIVKTFEIFSSVTTLPSVVFPPLSHGHLRWVCAFHKILTLLAILCLFGFTRFSCNHGKKYSVGLYLQIVKPWQ